MTLLTAYHDATFNHKDREVLVDKTVKLLEQIPQHAGIVCTGLSGILVAVPAAEKTNREFAIVRKPGEQNHSTLTIEGYTFDEYVIVDDFIEEGKTLKRIIREMSRRRDDHHPKCVGAILYKQRLRKGPVFIYADQEIPIYYA